MSDASPAAERDFADMDTTRLPTERVVELARQQALLDSEPRVHGPEGAEVDEWATLKEATVEDVRWEDGDLHLWMETETHVAKKVRDATRRQPAECRNHYPDTHVSITWDLDPENSPAVDIEVEYP